MPKFGKRSLENLKSCNYRLQILFEEVVKTFDCSILEGHREEMIQNRYYSKDKSKLKWPDSKHNRFPSFALDATPYPIKWDDIMRFYYFAGYVKGVARMMDIPLRWGGDWDDDTQTKDERFKDLVHFELPMFK